MWTFTRELTSTPPTRHLSERGDMADLASLFSASPSLDDGRVRYDFFLLRPPASSPRVGPGGGPQDANAASPPNEQEDDRAEVERVRDDMLAFAAQQTRGFLWHRHRFYLQTRALPEGLRRVRGLRAFYLAGETAVGDAVQDEWVVARLVFALTRRNPLLIARTSDSDGEFLLIEAADALPDWVTPENSADRVLVRDGHVHIHRPSASSGSGKRRSRTSTDAVVPIALVDAIDAMAVAIGSSDGVSRAFEAGAPMQRALARKLEQETPVYMRENRHYARCLLPTRAALVLSHNPGLVAPAVEAFYYREPTHARQVCGHMAIFGPLGGSSSAVAEKRVAFSRAMFAQLMQQRFHPPKPFLAAPHSRYQVLLSPSSESARRSAADLGVKLACGLELLYAAESVCDQFGVSYRGIIDGILATQDASAITDDSDELKDDDKAWMAVHPDALEEQLAGLGRRFERHESDDEDATTGDVGGAEELQQVAAMFGSFFGGKSDVDGVQGAAPIQFDMSSFMDILNGASGGQDAGDSDDESDSDEDNEDAALMEAMAEMEVELADSTLAKSFVRPDGYDAAADAGSVDSDDEEEEEKPQVMPETSLDLDFNLLSNLLESFASQDGQAGPVSNILSELRLPRAVDQ